MALMQCLDLEVISDGKYADDVLEVMSMQNPDDVRAAVQHASEILDMLDIMNGTEYRLFRDTIFKWFAYAQKIGKKEYVTHGGQWFERAWEKVALKKAKNKLVTVYCRDFSESERNTCGLSVLLNDGKTSKPLTNGGKMEKRTKLTVSEQQKFIGGFKNRIRDADTSEKIRQRGMLIEMRHRTVRNEHVNDTAQEILGYSRKIFVCDATTFNDIQFYVRNGIHELMDLLKLIELMVRKNENPVSVEIVDTRNMRFYYEQNRHETVAVAVARMNGQLIDMVEKL